MAAAGFLERHAHRLPADAVHHLQFHQPFGQQLQSPLRGARGRTRQLGQLRLPDPIQCALPARMIQRGAPSSPPSPAVRTRGANALP